MPCRCSFPGRFLFVLMFLTVLLGGYPFRTASAADDKDLALAHFNAGVTLFAAENYQAAATEFEASVRLYPTQNGYYNLANCLKALHQYDKAVRVLDELWDRFGYTMDEGLGERVDALAQSLLPLVGKITVSVVPAEAEVFLDGESMGKSPLEESLVVLPGPHTVAVRKPGFDPVTRTVTVDAAETMTVDIQLTAAMAALRIITTPSDATVALDGAVVGASPMDDALRVTPSTHMVSVTKSDYEKWETAVTLNPGEERALNVVLTPKPPPPRPVVKVPTDDELEEKRKEHIAKRLLYVGLAGSLSLGVGSVVFYAMAAKQASDFRRYDDAYVLHPETREENDIKRHDAKNKNEAYAAAGLGLGIAAGTVFAATGALFGWYLYRYRREAPGVSVVPGGMEVRF